MVGAPAGGAAAPEAAAAVDPAAVTPQVDGGAGGASPPFTCSEDAATAFSFPESFLCCGSTTREQLQLQFGPVDAPANAADAAAAARGFFLAHVPAVAPPGSTIRVQAPEGGSILDVMIPPGATPGSILSIARPLYAEATSADATIKELAAAKYDDRAALERQASREWDTGKVRLARDNVEEPKKCCWPFNGIRSATTASAPWRASTRPRTR